MARPPLALGHHGTVHLTRKGKGWAARCRVRDLDGVTRQIEKRGTSRAAAQRALQDELRQRHGQRVEALRPYSRFRDAADIWMLKIRERRADSTYDLYTHWLNKLVLPQLGELRLVECDVANIDAFFSRLERARLSVVQDDGSIAEKPHYAAATRRTVRSVVSGVLQQAVLHQAIATNPVRNLERIESTKGHQAPSPRGLTPEERRRLFTYVDTDPVSVAADLPDLIRFAIGTGLRIGELCAVRWRDVNLEGIAVVNEDDMRLVPVVAVRQNVYPVKGKGLSVHGGKTSMALRIVPLPEFVADRLRLRRHGDEPLDWPVFASAGRDGRPTYRWPSTLRRTIRTVRAQVGLDWMTPHSWRRTYATILDDEMTLTDRAKADLMGQAKFLKDAYVSRGELHPNAALLLDAALR